MWVSQKCLYLVCVSRLLLAKSAEFYYCLGSLRLPINNWFGQIVLPLNEPNTCAGGRSILWRNRRSRNCIDRWLLALGR